MMRSIVLVAGARPNFMKVAPILRALRERSSNLVPSLVHTGQHYDFEMSGVFFEQLGIDAPTVSLQVGSGSHGAQTGRLMSSFEAHLLGLPDLPRGVLVVGDVNSTMACALVATKLGIAVAHVEAGLRSCDRTMPEEINRLVTDAVADLLLVSEPSGLDNLVREGVDPSRIHYVGNVMIDSLIDQLPAARALEMAKQLGVRPREYALVTLHRPSNVDSPERLAALAELVERIAKITTVVFPVHPRTRHKLEELGLAARLAAAPGVRLCAPLGYREFLGAMDTARVVVTDSGGIQEETTHLGVSCITLRSNTERPITITQGTNVLVGDSVEDAWNAVQARLVNPALPAAPIDGWDGRAAHRIIDVLLDRWS